MGPLGGGVGAAGLGRRDARRWRDRLAHAWGVQVGVGSDPFAPDLFDLVQELERGLELIDFPEVTLEDRVTFLEHAVAWEVRRALAAVRFDLALDLQAWGARRIAGLQEERWGWRPILIYGAARPQRPARKARPAS